MVEQSVASGSGAASGAADGASTRSPATIDRTYRSVEERVERGRAARRQVPRSSHAEFAPAADRVDVASLFERQASTRVPELVPIRHGRMIESSFNFFRGAALVMANDLATTPVSGVSVQLCGDAHLSNFGVFGSPERNLLFDVNDFDETLPGPWEWDVKRLVASMAVAARSNGFNELQRRDILLATARRYREAMRKYAGMTNLEVWYAHVDPSKVGEQAGVRLDAARRARVEKTLQKARSRDSLQAFSRMCTVVDGQARIVADPPLVVPASDLFPEFERAAMVEWVTGLLTQYRHTLTTDRRRMFDQFRFVDLARKVVGVGSVGTRCWIVLLEGRDSGDPLFLQVKEAEASVLTDFVGMSAYDNQGHRVVAGQRLMQASSDIFLGWQRILGLDGVNRDYYIRQLRDWKGAAVVEQMDPTGMAQYGEICALTLARAHARSGDRVAIAAYMGSGDTLDRSLATFAELYADQNEIDHAAVEAAVASGRLEAQRGL
jgi:uncharacterized protein (DUF2252 family)